MYRTLSLSKDGMKFCHLILKKTCLNDDLTSMSHNELMTNFLYYKRYNNKTRDYFTSTRYSTKINCIKLLQIEKKSTDRKT